MSKWATKWITKGRSIFAALAIFGSGCGAPTMDITTPEGRDAIIFAVNSLLTNGDCVGAINLIEPLYNSQYTNNAIRQLRASAHGCFTGIDYFPFLTSLGNANLAGGQFWVSMAKLFPYTDAGGLQSGWYAADALMAAISNTAVVAAANQFNLNGPNPGSELTSDRTANANAYLVFTSMAVLGRTENRNGAPDSSYHKTQNLPWTTTAAMTAEGCAYAGAVVNMLDGASVLVGYATGTLKTELQVVSSTFQAAIGTACETGCQACGFAAGACTAAGSFCPMELRYRGNCSPVNTSKATCAAIGIINMVNGDPLLKWP